MDLGDDVDMDPMTGMDAVIDTMVELERTAESLSVLADDFVQGAASAYVGSTKARMLYRVAEALKIWAEDIVASQPVPVG
ncbi:hypothetical protein LTR65_004433 [Meristemomyces frigidus]